MLRVTAASASGVILSDVPAPVVGPPLSLSGPPVPPAHRIYFYSSGEWEAFIKEWVIGLGNRYVQVKGLGGSDDEGIDVAAFKSPQGLEGPWDCYQGKHYNRELRPADAWPEMVKVFRHVVQGDYTLPEGYYFLAPKGCGLTLNRLLSKPEKLRRDFLNALASGGAFVRGIGQDVMTRICDLAKQADFSMFKSVELHEALKVHAETPYHIARFGAERLSRTTVSDPPVELASHETKYVAELRRAYAEACAGALSEDEPLGAHPRFGEHFKRQRYSFYSAEALRMDVRDAVPEGTFERLQDDVHSGVVEIVEDSHPSSMSRLAAVLQHATILDLSAHPLVSLTRPDDRKGICHQLANESRVAWTREGR